MSIKSRIAFAVAFLLAIITLLGLVSYQYLKQLDEQNQAVYASSYLKLTAIEEAQYELTRLASALLQAARPLQQRNVARFEVAVRRLEKRMQSEADSDVGISRAVLQDLSMILDIAEQRLLPADQASAPLTEERLEQLISDAAQGLHSQFQLNEQAVALTFRENQRTTKTARQRIVLIDAICILFCAFILIWLPNYVTQPFDVFARGTRAVAEGDFSTRLDVARRDEFGQLAESFNAMIAQLEEQSNQSVGELLASRNQLRGLVNELDEMILGMDHARTIVFMNRNMEQYLGLSSEQALGAYMPDLALTKPRLQQLFEPIALGQARAIEPFESQDAEGRRRFLQERVVELQGAEGQLSGYIITLTDVTEYEEKTSRQTDFLATLSHEMKTPIAAIKMSLNLLEDERLGQLDEDQLELTSTVRTNSERLLRMVNEVLRHSENESGDVRLTIETIELIDVVKSSLTNLQPLALEKALALPITIEPNLPLIEADPLRIEWVLNNVIANAIRYAPVESSIEIDLFAVPGGVHVVVTDQGPGVPVGEAELIFEKYRRATGDSTKGTGLGLAISREYVEAHSGRIYVDTAYTEGARFVVELPRLLPEQHRTLSGA